MVVKFHWSRNLSPTQSKRNSILGQEVAKLSPLLKNLVRNGGISPRVLGLDVDMAKLLYWYYHSMLLGTRAGNQLVRASTYCRSSFILPTGAVALTRLRIAMRARTNKQAPAVHLGLIPSLLSSLLFFVLIYAIAKVAGCTL